MGDLLVSNGFRALPKADDDQMTMVDVIYFTSTLR
jgi:hypothetical protein